MIFSRMLGVILGLFGILQRSQSFLEFLVGNVVSRGEGDHTFCSYRVAKRCRHLLYLLILNF